MAVWLAGRRAGGGLPVVNAACRLPVATASFPSQSSLATEYRPGRLLAVGCRARLLLILNTELRAATVANRGGGGRRRHKQAGFPNTPQGAMAEHGCGENSIAKEVALQVI